MKLILFLSTLIMLNYISTIKTAKNETIKNETIECDIFIEKHATEPNGPISKPVIYLYPEESIDIKVKLNIKDSKFTTIYPKFNEKNTWNVHAEPNGDIILNNKKYPYLFWEAISYKEQELNEGFL